MEKITVDAFRRMYIPIGWRQINIMNDECAESIEIEVPRYYGKDRTDLSVYSMYLKTISSGGRDDILLSPVVYDDTISAVWTLKPPQTSYEGVLCLQLRFEGSDFKWETPVAQIEILSSPDDSAVAPTSPSAYDGWLDEIQAIADSVLNMTVSAETADLGYGASVEKSVENGVVNLHFKLPASSAGGVAVSTLQAGNALYWNGNTLNVNTTNNVAENNTLPITSAGVYQAIGDINALLATV